MANVIQMVRKLYEPPRIAQGGRIALRNYLGEQDIAHWLRIRHDAFAREKLGVRQWREADFRRELIDKAWWNPGRMWFADPMTDSTESATPVGTITCAVRGVGAAARPVVHWLAVAPRWRRRGIARLLMSALEAQCWEDGHREVLLETHQSWAAATAFYKALGYQVAGNP